MGNTSLEGKNGESIKLSKRLLSLLRFPPKSIVFPDEVLADFSLFLYDHLYPHISKSAISKLHKCVFFNRYLHDRKHKVGQSFRETIKIYKKRILLDVYKDFIFRMWRGRIFSWYWLLNISSFLNVFLIVYLSLYHLWDIFKPSFSIHRLFMVSRVQDKESDWSSRFPRYRTTLRSASFFFFSLVYGLYALLWFKI